MHLLALFALALLAGYGGTPPPSLAQDSKVFYDPTPPPPSLEEFTNQSGAVLVVSVYASEPSDHVPEYPLTEYCAMIIEVLKGHPRIESAAPGMDVTFLEIAGEKHSAKGVARTAHAKSLQPGDRAVVFLRWTEGWGAFQLESGHHGVYLIKGQKLQPVAPTSELARSWGGKPPAEFFARIKSAKGRK